MGCLYSALVLLLNVSGWLARRTVDAFVVFWVLALDERATVTFWAHGYEKIEYYCGERHDPLMAPSPVPTLATTSSWNTVDPTPVPTQPPRYESDNDEISRDFITIFDMDKGPLCWPSESLAGYIIYIVVIACFWLVVSNRFLDFIMTKWGSALKRTCSCSRGSGAGTVAARGAGGLGEEQPRGLRGCCAKRVPGRVEDAGEFKMIPEREVQELEIPTADAIFGSVNELVQKLKNLNDAIVDLATRVRETLGEPEEERLLWKEWVATKTRVMKESVTATAPGQINWKEFFPKIDMAQLAVGELSITMPMIESVVAAPATRKFMDVFKDFADKIVDLVTSEMPDLIPEVGNLVSEATSLDPSALQEEVASVVGSNPFKIVGILSAIKNNTAITLGLKGCVEIIIHNVSTLLNGLKDGMYKGLHSPALQRPAPGRRAGGATHAKETKDAAGGKGEGAAEKGVIAI